MNIVFCKKSSTNIVGNIEYQLPNQILKRNIKYWNSKMKISNIVRNIDKFLSCFTKFYDAIQQPIIINLFWL